LTSQLLIAIEPWHNIMHVLIWLFVLLHVSLSTRFILRCEGKAARDPELAFRER
jgi:hypothetical protein